MKIILTAIVVGMICVFTLHRFAKVNLHIKPTYIGANIITRDNLFSRYDVSVFTL